MNRVLLVCVLSVVLCAPASATDRYPRLQTATDGYTVSDGRRWVAWFSAPDVPVLDDSTGKVASYPLP